MRHFLRHLPLLLLAGCAIALPSGRSHMLAAAGIGCERTEHGVEGRAIAIYTRVVADRVCILDAAGRCHPRVDAGSVRIEVRLPQTQTARPADALRQELGRRGILIRIARPRGPKMYASQGEHRDDGLLVLELGEIAISDDGDAAHVMVRASGTMDASDWSGTPGGALVRLVRTRDVGDEGLSRRMTSPVRACWRLNRSTSSTLAD
jgi:hypothetical protein